MIIQYIGGAAVTGAFTVTVLLLNRLFAKRDKKDAETNEDSKRLSALEEFVEVFKAEILESKRDRCRIQLLIMMTHYPNDVSQIMKLAERYFSQLHGDWYMTGVFNCWLTENGVGKPEWFNSET